MVWWIPASEIRASSTLASSTLVLDSAQWIPVSLIPASLIPKAGCCHHRAGSSAPLILASSTLASSTLVLGSAARWIPKAKCYHHHTGSHLHLDNQVGQLHSSQQAPHQHVSSLRSILQEERAPLLARLELRIDDPTVLCNTSQRHRYLHSSWHFLSTRAPRNPMEDEAARSAKDQ